MWRYVVGFAFSSGMSNVLLIRKKSPRWQKGLLNGIGGKIEKGESPLDAMRRECKEETGLILNWEHRGHMAGINDDKEMFQCHLFYAYSDDIFKFEQLENEILGLYSPHFLRRENIVDSLHFLIPFGKCRDRSVQMILEY